MSNFTVKGDVSRIAGRVTNFYFRCFNPAFGLSKEVMLDSEDYLELPNSHSAIVCQAYNFPSPMANREAIASIIWKVSISKLLVDFLLTYVANTPSKRLSESPSSWHFIHWLRTRKSKSRTETRSLGVHLSLLTI